MWETACELSIPSSVRGVPPQLVRQAETCKLVTPNPSPQLPGPTQAEAPTGISRYLLQLRCFTSPAIKRSIFPEIFLDCIMLQPGTPHAGELWVLMTSHHRDMNSSGPSSILVCAPCKIRDRNTGVNHFCRHLTQLLNQAKILFKPTVLFAVKR